MTKSVIGLLLALCCLSLTAFSQMTEQSKPTPTPKPKAEHFTAVASLPRSPTRTAWVDIRINRYTDDATTQRLATVLVEGGQDALVKELEKAETVGHASLSARVGFFDLKLIRSRKTPTGRRIIGVSDRPIGFLEAYGGGRSMDYKLGIVVLDLKRNKKGKEVGEGVLLYASQVKIEYQGMDPIKLRNVQKQ
jgi:hypothetical protein